MDSVVETANEPEVSHDFKSALATNILCAYLCLTQYRDILINMQYNEHIEINAAADELSLLQPNIFIHNKANNYLLFCTVCPRSSNPIYVVSY